MPNTLCPKCNSSEVYVTEFSPLQAGESNLGIYNPDGNNIRLEVSLCAQCGFAEISARKDELGKLPKLVKTKYWRKKA